MATNGIIPQLQAKIDTLKAELATAQAALQAQSEALAAARQTERELHDALLLHEDCDLTASRAHHRVEIYCNQHHAIIYSEPLNNGAANATADEKSE